MTNGFPVVALPRAEKLDGQRRGRRMSPRRFEATRLLEAGSVRFACPFPTLTSSVPPLQILESVPGIHAHFVTWRLQFGWTNT